MQEYKTYVVALYAGVEMTWKGPCIQIKHVKFSRDTIFRCHRIPLFAYVNFYTGHEYRTLLINNEVWIKWFRHV